MSQHTPKWVAGYARGEICDRSTMQLVGRFVTNEDRDRAIACREACIGMSDPEAEITAKDARIKALEGVLETLMSLDIEEAIRVEVLSEPYDLRADREDYLNEQVEKARALLTPTESKLSAPYA